MTIVTTYNGPDLDGYGCVMAYKELLALQGVESEARVWDEPLIEVTWLQEYFSLPRALGPIKNDDQEVILLDISSVQDIPGGFDPKQVVEVIDHRKVHDGELFVNAKVQIEKVGAAATLVAEKFKHLGFEPSKEAALYLLGGIISNTQNFSSVVTTNRDREMSEWLFELSGAPSNLAEMQFKAKSDLSGVKLRDALIGDKKAFHFDSVTVLVAQLEIYFVDELLEERMNEVRSIFSEMVVRDNADFAFINLKNLETGVSIMVCHDEKTQNLLNDLDGIFCENLLCKSSTITLRKQIAVLIKDKLS